MSFFWNRCTRRPVPAARPIQAQPPPVVDAVWRFSEEVLMSGVIVAMACDVPAAPVIQRSRTGACTRRTLRGIPTRSPVPPIRNDPERARSVEPVCGRCSATLSAIFFSWRRWL
jgi:hypothetical protein